MVIFVQTYDGSNKSSLHEGVTSGAHHPWAAFPWNPSAAWHDIFRRAFPILNLHLAMLASEGKLAWWTSKGGGDSLTPCTVYAGGVRPWNLEKGKTWKESSQKENTPERHIPWSRHPQPAPKCFREFLEKNLWGLQGYVWQVENKVVFFCSEE